jgi:calcineurin-like phosphoesterase family protein
MIYLTSDTHYGHESILQYCNRPFATVDDMNEAMIAHHNAIVGQDDTVIHCGDFALGKKLHWPTYFRRLNGRKRLVLGNHDGTRTAMLALGFEEVEEELYVEYNGVRFWCAHIPPANTMDHRGYVRPAASQPYDIALCGHIHDRWKQHADGTINVGVDVWHFRPVSAETLIAYVRGRVKEPRRNIEK